MEASKAPSFEHVPLKENIERIAASMKEHAPEEGRATKAAVRETLAPTIMAAVKTADEPLSEAEKQILPEYLKDEPVETRVQVEKLIDVAWHKNVRTAVKLARKAGDPLIIDALHDALVDKLYDELKRQGHI